MRNWIGYERINKIAIFLVPKGMNINSEKKSTFSCLMLFVAQETGHGR